MNVLGPAWIKSGYDRIQLVASGLIGKLVPAQGKAGVIVLSLGICLPEVYQGVRDRHAIRRQDISGQGKLGSGDARFDQRGAFRRVRFEVWAFCYSRG